MEPISDADEGKDVVNASGEKTGIVVEVTNGRAHVDPDPALTDTLLSKLGWGSRDEGTYLLAADTIATVADNQIRTRSL